MIHSVNRCIVLIGIYRCVNRFSEIQALGRHPKGGVRQVLVSLTWNTNLKIKRSGLHLLFTQPTSGCESRTAACIAAALFFSTL